MKKIQFLAIMVSLMIGLASCSKDDSGYGSNTTGGNTATTSSIITKGSWRITYFSDSGIDRTTIFSGYAFTFDSSGAVAATNGSSVTNGTWNSFTSTTDNQNKFMVSFGVTPPPLNALKNEWTIIEMSATRIRMQKNSVLAGHIDYLVIEKI